MKSFPNFALELFHKPIENVREAISAIDELDQFLLDSVQDPAEREKIEKRRESRQRFLALREHCEDRIAAGDTPTSNEDLFKSFEALELQRKQKVVQILAGNPSTVVH